MQQHRKQFATESQALYERLFKQSLHYPPDSLIFIRISRVMQKVARRCYRRNMNEAQHVHHNATP